MSQPTPPQPNTPITFWKRAFGVTALATLLTGGLLFGGLAIAHRTTWSETTWLGIGTAILVLLGTLASSYMTFRVQDKRANAQNILDDAMASEKIGAAWRVLNEEKDAAIAALTARVSSLERELAATRELEARRAEVQIANRARIAALESHVQRLEKEREIWRAEREEMKHGVNALIRQLEALEIKPAWKPKDTGTGPLPPKGEHV